VKRLLSLFLTGGTAMKKTKELSVWTWQMSKIYYLKRPWKWIQELFINIRNAWQRTKYGYCYLDWANFHEWFSTIAPMMLRDMAHKGMGYPGNEPFETHEKWEKWLEQMADQLMWCSETAETHNNTIFRNEYAEDYDRIIDREIEECRKNKESWITMNNKTPEDKEIKDKYINREFEIQRERETLIKSTLNELSEHWFSLWD
jgi:hypothetical protein